MRPRFTVGLTGAQAGVLEVLARHVRSPKGPVRGWVRAEQAELHLASAEQFFSPVLHLTLLEEGGEKTLHCRFAPLPQVWLIFVGIYFILGMCGVGALVYGACQQLLGQPAWGYLGAPAALALAAFVYGAAFIGQGLSSEQMYKLRSWLDHALEEAEKSAP